MPEFRDQLSAAASLDVVAPPFSSLRERARRKTVRRRTASALAVVAVVALASVAVASGSRTAQQAAAPCVTPSAATDVLAVIPSSGTVTIDVHADDYLTIGWRSCTETGTFTVALSGKVMLSGLYGTSPSQSSARVYVFGTGTTSIEGDGSEGSHGTLLIRSTFRAEPAGMSSPSPYPVNPQQYAGPEICKAGDVADSEGRLTRSVTYEDGQHLLDPPGEVRSKYTREQVLEHMRNGHFRITGDGVQAVFGLLTAENYGGGNRLPRWIVYRCEVPDNEMVSHGGPAYHGPTPAAGTTPEPYGHTYGVILEPIDENLTTVYMMSYGYSDDATLSQEFVEVPFTRSHDDSADGRQIGIAYSTYPCATFSHLDVREADGNDSVYVRVWLRVTGDVPCDPSGTATAVVGLRTALGDRQLVRGRG